MSRRQVRERHEQRKQSFDTNPQLYEKARPSYPEELFDDLIHLSGIRPGDRILEIGPGTGQATLPLARRNFRITAVELGPRMARRCAQNLRAFPKVAVHNCAFEQWPIEAEAYDLAVSASAFHWIPAGIGFRRVAQALKPERHLALIWVFGEDQKDPLSLALHQTYQQFGLKPWRPRPPEVRIQRQVKRIENSGLFGPVAVRRYPGSQEYSADSYIALLRTMSDHAILSNPTRHRLFQLIREIFTYHGGTYTRHFISVLLLAAKRRAP